MAKSLEELINEHRKNTYLTCDKDCFCWDAEAWLNSPDTERRRTPREADKPIQDGSWWCTCRAWNQSMNIKCWNCNAPRPS
jgi:hypothetical protein